MANESIGGVSVAITGDLSSLKTAFATAQSTAQQAGAGVAAAFNAGAGTVGTLETAVVELTGAIRELNVTLEQSAVSSAGAAAGQRAHAAAIHGTTSEIQATSGALRVLEGSGGIRAAERFLTMIPGLGPALQAAFPVIGALALFDAMDKLLGKATGLKEAEAELATQTKATDDAFTSMVHTVDNINVGAMSRQFGEAAGHFAKAKEIGAESRDAAEKVNDLVHQMLVLDKESTDIGQHPILLMPYYSEQFRQAQQDKIKAIQEQIGAIQGPDRIAAQKKVDDELAKGELAAAEQNGRLAAQRVTNEQQANARMTEIDRARLDGTMTAEHAAIQQSIAGLDSEYERVVKTGEAEIKYAQAKQAAAKGFALATRDELVGSGSRTGTIQRKAGDEAAGKSQPEQQLIREKAQGDIEAANDAYKKSGVDSQNAVDAAAQKAGLSVVELNQKVTAALKNLVTEGWDKATKAAKDTSDEFVKATDASLLATAKVMEIQAKSQGETGALQLQGQKLLLERAYGLEVGHTAAQQIAYQAQLAAIDNQARTAKLTGLAAELQAAQGIKNNQVQIAEIEAKMSALSVQNANASIAAQTKLLELDQQKTLQFQLQHALVTAGQAVPGAVGGALATGAMNGGKGIGQDVAQALKGVGQQLLGTVFKAVIEKLIAELVVHAGLTSLLATITGTAASTQAAAAAAQATASGVQTTALAANTVALAANTAAQAASAGVGAAGAGASAAGGVASVATSAASAATAGATQAVASIIGGIIAAIGAVVGGIISGTMSAAATLFGDAKIVAAIHGTTAAVLALRTAPIANGAAGGSGTGSTDPNAQADLTAGGGGIWSFIGKIFGQGAMPVSIVSISPLAGLNGVLGLFGFAGGGSPAVGVPSWVGERGKELFIPREAGVIVPNSQLGSLGGGGLPMPSTGLSSSSSSSSSIGEMHFHVNGAKDSRETVRAIATYMRSASPKFSPAGSS